MEKNKFFTIFATLIVIAFRSGSANAQEEQVNRFNVRLNPLIIAIGGNLDIDIHLTPAWTVGPSLFGWGGCENRSQEVKTREGNECNTWMAYGVRANYRFLNDSLISGVYIGPGFYHVKKAFSYGHSGQSLSGEISGSAFTTIIGYLYRFNSWVNVSGGIGELVFLEKPSDVSISNSSIQTVIPSGSSTQILAELSVGLSF